MLPIVIPRTEYYYCHHRRNSEIYIIQIISIIIHNCIKRLTRIWIRNSSRLMKPLLSVSSLSNNSSVSCKDNIDILLIEYPKQTSRQIMNMTVSTARLSTHTHTRVVLFNCKVLTDFQRNMLVCVSYLMAQIESGLPNTVEKLLFIQLLVAIIVHPSEDPETILWFIIAWRNWIG